MNLDDSLPFDFLVASGTDTSSDGSDPVSSPSLTLAGFGSGATPIVTGIAEAGATVTLYDGTAVLGTATANAATGTYHLTGTGLEAGEHVLTATATDARGGVSAPSNPLTVEVGTAATIVGELDTLETKAGLSAIVLTDTHVLPVASVADMNHLIGSDANALAAIQGAIYFAVTSPTATSTAISYYTSTGLLTNTLITQTNGTKTLDTFDASGTLIRVGTTYTDKSQDIHKYYIAGQTYTTEHDTDNSAGVLTSQIRTHADGTPASSYVLNADGSSVLENFDASGTMIRKGTTYADKSQDIYKYGITGQSYTTEHDTDNSAGVLTSQIRTHADGTSASTYVLNIGGSSELDTYNASGILTRQGMIHADGSQDITKYSGTSPDTVTEHDVLNAQGTQILVDQTQADGSHKAFISGVGQTLTSTTGVSDNFNNASAGSTTFVFNPSFGQDLISGFHAGTGSNHDVIKINDAALTQYSELVALMNRSGSEGSDTLITIDPNDTILLKHVAISSLDAMDFRGAFDGPPPVVGVALKNDTGASASDLITNLATLIGTGAPGAVVSFTIDGKAATTTATADGSGNYSYTPAGLADGSHTIVASETDLAGDTGTASLTFTFETAKPVVTEALTSDTGSSQMDGITSNDALAGTGDANAVIHFTVDGLAAAGTASVNGNGAWTFTPSGLADGSHTIVASETDLAGNTGTASLTFTLDTINPTVAITSPDGKVTTAGQTITGTVSDAHPGATVLLYDNGSNTALGTATVTNGVWSADVTLASGANSLVAINTDTAGNTGTASVSFTLGSTVNPPPAPVFALAPADQTAANETQSASVTLAGHTGANDTVALSTGATTIASNTGSFQFSNVGLALGDNPLVATATDALGQTNSFSLDIQRLAPASTPDAAVQWNQITLNAIKTEASNPEIASRNLAIESLAVYDAISGIDGTPGYLVNMKAPAGASADAAVAAAAYEALVNLYPNQKASFDALLKTSLAAIPDGPAKTDGIAYGTAVADEILALRANDGWNTYVDDEGSTTPGQWQPTLPNNSPAEAPQWATLETFALNSPDQFRAPAPPSITSAAYAASAAKTESLGAADSTTRTADETQIAKFWADGTGTYTPPGAWNAIADQVATAQGNSLAQDARLLAELNVAEADSAIAAWDTKYTYNTERPITVIEQADAIGNPGITEDPTWVPLIPTPSHPEYVSGHSTFSDAAAQILDSTFGTSYAFSTTSTSLGGVTRSFTSFDQAAQEASDSRIYGGIHFDYSVAAGEVIGTSVGQWTLQAFDLTKDIVPPKILLDQTSGLVTNKALTLTGNATDNLSGVASLTVSIDGGAATAVTLNADGTFSAPLTLALDGTEDGAHKAEFIATDAAGNVSAPVDFSVTLDTKAPTVALATTSVQDGGTLSAGAAIAGTIKTEAGVTLNALSYSIDGGKAAPLSFDATGAFSQAIDLTHLGAGKHVLTLTALDAAGNTSTDTLNLSLPSLPPLTIAAITPMMGAGDVGVTYRPKITFSRAVDPATLTSDSFYATDSTGAKVAATILPTSDGTGAYLLFTDPLPGASTITMHIDGSQIKAAADGALLDAAGTGTPGSVETDSFTTVGTAPVPNTSISGIVVDPGPDLTPMTPDDVKSGPQGLSNFTTDTFKLPIAHVKVYILGHEDEAVYTDAKGAFTLSSVPTGDVKVVFDGRAATNAPSGLYFPTMTMDTTIRPGIVNTIMGSMGTQDQQSYYAADPAVYLPRVQNDVLQSVSDTTPTVVTLPQDASGGLTAQQASQMSLTVAPGSLVDANGNPVTNAQVGISTVPPQIVMDMLPAGVMQHTFDITIQAPQGALFTTPAILTLPNVFAAAPGTKLDILSFDHTTGKLVIDGTGTVSADGQTVTTDPGSGVTQPGWHGMTPPGVDLSSITPSPVEGTGACAILAAAVATLAVSGATNAAVLLAHYISGSGQTVIFSSGSSLANEVKNSPE